MLHPRSSDVRDVDPTTGEVIDEGGEKEANNLEKFAQKIIWRLLMLRGPDAAAVSYEKAVDAIMEEYLSAKRS